MWIGLRQSSKTQIQIFFRLMRRMQEKHLFCLTRIVKLLRF